MKQTVIAKSTKLPNGWIKTTLKEIVLDPKQDIVDGPFGSNLKSSEYIEQGIPIIRLQNVNRNSFLNKNIKYISKEKAEKLRRHSFSKNDIVVTKLGEPLGEACLVPDFLGDGIIVADIIRIRLDHNFISKKFLTYLINSNYFINQFNKVIQGSTRDRIRLCDFREFNLLLPPQNEQKRIVSKIEKLFLELDNAQTIPKKTKLQLKQYRQSLLKSAFEGNLTKKWRTKNKILQKSTERWNITTPPLQDKSLPILPNSWCYRKLQDISKRVSVGHVGASLNFQSDKNSGVPYLRSQNIGSGKLLKLENIRYVTKEFHKKLKKSQLIEGDLLIVRHGDENNNACLLPKDFGPVNCANIIFARPREDISELLNFYFQSISCQKFLDSNRTGSVQRVVNTQMVAQVPIPIPSLKEQIEIIRKIKHDFLLIQNSENIINSMIKQLDTLRSSILNQAFEGKLVPQNPNDEPASILLEKIKT